MSLRPFQFPDDFSIIVDLWTRSFQYPENPEWGVQADEKAHVADTLRSLQRLWPIIRVGRLFSTSLRDSMEGFFWEENNLPVGFVAFRRQGATDNWYVSNLGVLPEYRRRGIARRLLESAIDSIQARKGKKILLDVIDENIPAYTMFEQFGLERYSSIGSFEYQGELPQEYSLPGEYDLLRLGSFDWQARYELDKRIVPANIVRYQPVEESLYHEPLLVYLVESLVGRFSGTIVKQFSIVSKSEKRVVAWSEYSVRARSGGVCFLRIRVDSAHPHLAPYLGTLIRLIQQISPGRRIRFSFPEWQSLLIQAAEEIGSKKRVQYHNMGLLL